MFDCQNPSGEAPARFYSLMARPHAARPAMTIVITAGNHDAAGRLEAPRRRLEAIGVRVIGNVPRRDGVIDPSHHLLPTQTSSGWWIAALPWFEAIAPVARILGS